jgi:predicted DCC family thiol-disulfide oxidoreductase YuxK
VTGQELQLTVWVDGDCGFCRRVAKWLATQPTYVPLHIVAAQSGAARGCPLTLEQLLAKITVTASDGAVYRGSNAWLVCLWALCRYRAWSLRLASTALRPLADRLFAAITGLAALTKRRGANS